MKKLLFCLGLLLVLPLGSAKAGDFGLYTVQKGDNLWEISKRFDVPFRSVLETNTGIKNYDLIYPKQKVALPLMATTLSVEEELFNLTNTYRKERGLPAFKYDWQLMRTARAKAREMARLGYSEHKSPNYGYIDSMARRFGLEFELIGENIGHTLESPSEAINAFKSYQEENIVNREFNYLGVGFAENAQTRYWVQIFIKK